MYRLTKELLLTTPNNEKRQKAKAATFDVALAMVIIEVPVGVDEENFIL